VTGQCAVRESESARLVDHVDDARRVEPPQAEHADDDANDLVLRDRCVGLDCRPAREHAPLADRAPGSCKHTLATTELTTVVIEVEARGHAIVARGAGVGIAVQQRALAREILLDSG
jgi:hypothetical protein